jgi:hypothetical protein
MIVVSTTRHDRSRSVASVVVERVSSERLAPHPTSATGVAATSSKVMRRGLRPVVILLLLVFQTPKDVSSVPSDEINEEDERKSNADNQQYEEQADWRLRIQACEQTYRCRSAES